ncbi:hypothetical protein BOTBODRAFT_26950 [Botryobasidium botryosum FD-172 SS1]|uniref:RING-type domain-containing protein n=1 Tax=Botryobasidium botryosum (strain FD-172 SS1) TaxID=930990 RepID=A0A067NAZ6_BOTB1|nr:hypothetical protein BOTBODRAFT_26950 [Botryobasidium botryosum FD-172 SS1]
MSVTCPICYDTAIHKNIACFPCGHTLCQPCSVRSLSCSGKARTQCPMCSLPHTGLAIKLFLEVSDRDRTPLPNEIHYESGDATPMDDDHDSPDETQLLKLRLSALEMMVQQLRGEVQTLSAEKREMGEELIHLRREKDVGDRLEEQLEECREEMTALWRKNLFLTSEAQKDRAAWAQERQELVLARERAEREVRKKGEDMLREKEEYAREIDRLQKQVDAKEGTIDGFHRQLQQLQTQNKKLKAQAKLQEEERDTARPLRTRASIATHSSTSSLSRNHRFPPTEGAPSFHKDIHDESAAADAPSDTARNFRRSFSSTYRRLSTFGSMAPAAPAQKPPSPEKRKSELDWLIGPDGKFRSLVQLGPKRSRKC